MSNENLSGKTEPQWVNKEKKDKEDRESIEQIMIPARTESFDSKIIMPYEVNNEEFECVAGTKKKEIENQKNEDGVFFKNVGKYSYFAAIDGIGNADGYEATQQIMEKLDQILKRKDYKAEGNSNLETILSDINKDLYKNNKFKLSSCIAAAQYNQEKNELKIINAGDTRGIVFDQDERIKHLTAVQIHLTDILKWAIKNEHEAAKKIKNIMFKKGFENADEIRNFSPELINELIDEIDINKRSALAISSYLGNKPENNKYDVNSIEVEQGDYLALVTDGISSHDTLCEKEVVKTIVNSNNLKTAMKKLIQKGKERKSHDDTSGIITRFK